MSTSPPTTQEGTNSQCDSDIEITNIITNAACEANHDAEVNIDSEYNRDIQVKKANKKFVL